MRILILGAKGFIGSRLSTLLKRKNFEVLEFDKDNTVDELLSLLKQTITSRYEQDFLLKAQIRLFQV